MTTVRRALLLLLVPMVAPTLMAEQPEIRNEDDFMGLVREGPSWTAEETASTLEIQKGHLANIDRLVDDGKLLLAGPFLDDGDLRGIFVFKSPRSRRRHASSRPTLRCRQGVSS